MVNALQSNPSKKKALGQNGPVRSALIDGLQQVYAAERHWLTVLPILQLAADSDLLDVLMKLDKDGKEHIQRLEMIFQLLEVAVLPTENKDVEVLIDECYDIIDITPRHSFIRSAGLVVAIQQIHQYQVTAYTSLLAQALEQGMQRVVNLIKVIIHQKHREEEQLALVGTNNLLDEIS